MLGLAGDPFAGECVRRQWSEFARAAYRVTGTRPVDPAFDQRRQVQAIRVAGVETIEHIEFDQRLEKLFDAAKEKDVWKGAPAARDRAEYWAAGVEGLFPTPPAQEQSRPMARTGPSRREELLKAYDPELYVLVDETVMAEQRACGLAVQGLQPGRKVSPAICRILQTRIVILNQDI